ncbi:MAG: type I methionyl aminopeptidase [Flavobacteriales bacterium]|nr:type I methionyl aminopeptidase [Flavobacteriales bacterium]
MIYHKTEEEIEFIRESSLLVSKALAEVARVIKPGVTSLELDKVAETVIRDHGGEPAFKGYRGFPNTLCVSPNAQVVHGIPNNEPFQEGDIVSVDCGVLKNGFYGDSAFTFAIGEVPADVALLLRVTRESLDKGIEKAVAGNRLGDIGYAVQSHAEANGFTVVRELVGHGIGKNLHEEPEVPNYGRRGNGVKLSEGMVIAIEPMVNQGKRSIREHADGWTITTTDGKPSAHFEHTVAIGKGKAEVLSTFAWIDEVIENKTEEIKNG